MGPCRALTPRLLFQLHQRGGTGGVGRVDAEDRGKAILVLAAWLKRVLTCLSGLHWFGNTSAGLAGTRLGCVRGGVLSLRHSSPPVLLL